MTDAQNPESLMLSGSATTVAQNPVARGQRATWLATLAGAGSLAGGTLTANIRAKGSVQVLVSQAPTISDATNRIIDLTLSEAQTLLLIGDPNNPQQTVQHIADVALTLSGVTAVYGPLQFDVRSPA